MGKAVCKGSCMTYMKNGMVDGMLIGLFIGAAIGLFKAFKDDDASADTQKMALDVADWSVHAAVFCSLIGALVSLIRGN